LLVFSTILSTLEFCMVLRRKISRNRLGYYLSVTIFLYLLTLYMLNEG